MKVPASTQPAPAASSLGGSALGKHTGGFDRILHGKEAKADKVPKEQATAATDAQIASPSSAPGNPLSILPTAPDNSKLAPIASHAVTVTNAQVQNIAHEIVNEIRSVTNKDGSRTVDIQFDSRTLQGLQVHVTEKQGTLSIKFATNSENIAALLADHQSDLTSALAADGFTVNNISTSVQPKRDERAATRDRSGQPDKRGK